MNWKELIYKMWSEAGIGTYAIIVILILTVGSLIETIIKALTH